MLNVIIERMYTYILAIVTSTKRIDTLLFTELLRLLTFHAIQK